MQCVLCSFYGVGSAENPREGFDPQKDDFEAEFGHVNRPCTKQDVNSRNCISAAYGNGDRVPENFVHGDGRITRVTRNSITTTYLNIPLRPETSYCLFVIAQVASGIGNVSEMCVTRYG